MLAFFRAQRPPYLPAQPGIAPGPGGGPVPTVELAGPSPRPAPAALLTAAKSTSTLTPNVPAFPDPVTLSKTSRYMTLFSSCQRGR